MLQVTICVISKQLISNKVLTKKTIGLAYLVQGKS